MDTRASVSEVIHFNGNKKVLTLPLINLATCSVYFLNIW